MSSLSLTTKVLLAYTIVFGLLLAGFAYIIYRSSRSAEFAVLDARLDRYAAAIRSELEEARPGSPSFDPAVLAAIRAEGLHGARFQLFAPGGRPVVVDSVLASFPGRVPLDSLKGSSDRITSGIDGVRYLVVWSSAKTEENARSILEVAAPMTEADNRLARLRLLLFISLPASLLLTACAAYLITRAALRPITRMTEAAKSLSAANLDQRISVPPSHDEVRVLAETLNGMIGRIDAAFQSQRQFVADASHELRTPLTVITTELEFAVQRSAGPARESIGIALAEVDRLARLTGDLLSLARLDAPRLNLAREPILVGKLLEECVGQMHVAAERRGITLRLQVECDADIEGDRTRVKSVILNLLDNAIMYSHGGTTVMASLEIFETPPRRAVIRIRDQGYGIAPEDIDRIFQRFYRSAISRSNEGGSGLGLAIADRIVQLHGGTITVESALGKGSTFSVLLPLRSVP